MATGVAMFFRHLGAPEAGLMQELLDSLASMPGHCFRNVMEGKIYRKPWDPWGEPGNFPFNAGIADCKLFVEVAVS